MKYTNKKLFELLQPLIDAMEGIIGDYPETDELVLDIIDFANGQKKELRERGKKSKWIGIQVILGK